MENESSENLFTCKDCGSNELVVIHTYEINIDYVAVNREELVVHERRRTEYWEESGPLDDEHRWEYEYHESNNYDDEEIDSYGIDEGELWKFSDDESPEEESEIDEDSHEFFVECAGCSREIEFGWSHPERGGRIWPAECIDFNPWKCFPEERCFESWKEKGWIRPMR